MAAIKVILEVLKKLNKIIDSQLGKYLNFKGMIEETGAKWNTE